MKFLLLVVLVSTLLVDESVAKNPPPPAPPPNYSTKVISSECSDPQPCPKVPLPEINTIFIGKYLGQHTSVGNFSGEIEMPSELNEDRWHTAENFQVCHVVKTKSKLAKKVQISVSDKDWKGAPSKMKKNDMKDKFDAKNGDTFLIYSITSYNNDPRYKGKEIRSIRDMNYRNIIPLPDFMKTIGLGNCHDTN